MSKIQRRATKQLPSVLLTLLSIIQAIALETLWDRTIHRPEFFEASWIATLGWLQVTVTFLVIVLVWIVYIALLMRFRWTPALIDLCGGLGVTHEIANSSTMFCRQHGETSRRNSFLCCSLLAPGHLLS